MEKISFKNLDGWLKTLVVMGWVSLGLSALGIAATVGMVLGELSAI